MSDLQVLPRSSWTTTPFAWPTFPTRLFTKSEVTYLAPHYPAIPRDIWDDADEAAEQEWMRTIRSWHVDGNGWADIGYGLVIFQSGRVYMAGGITHSTAHAASMNRYAIGVLFMVGNDQPPSPAAIATFNRLGPWLRDTQGFTRLTTVLDHGRLPGQSTSCAGPHVRAAVDRGDLNLLGGTDMTLLPFPAASAIQTDTFWVQLEAVFLQMGYDGYCGPSYVKRGFCRPIIPGIPGGHGHGPRSRHWDERALDVGFDPPTGEPVSDYEKAFLDGTVRMMIARYPRMGKVWNRGKGDHDDHAHFDDQNYGFEGEYSPAPLPPGVFGFGTGTPEQVMRLQRAIGAKVDGVFGLGTYDRLRAVQYARGLVPDGFYGPATEAALFPPPAPPRPPVQEQPVEPEKPTPTPPVVLDPPGRIGGVNAYHTATLAADAAPAERRSKVYLCARDGYTDQIGALSAGDGVVLLVERGSETLNRYTAEWLTAHKPSQVVARGGTAAVTVAAIRLARAHAGLGN